MSSKENRENIPAGSADGTSEIEKKINAAMDRITEDFPDETADEGAAADGGGPEDEEYENEEYDSEGYDAGEDGEEYDSEEYGTESYDSEEDGGEYGSETQEAEDDDSDEYEEGDLEEDAYEDEPSAPLRSRNKSARPGPVVYVPMDDLDEDMPLPSEKKKKKHKGLKITGFLLLMLVVLAGCAYGGISYYYSYRFFEGTWINGINCSGKTAYETELALADQIQDYSIQVMARNQEPQTITGEQINYQYLSSGEVLNLLKQQKPYEWIKGFYEQSSYTVSSR